MGLVGLGLLATSLIVYSPILLIVSLVASILAIVVGATAPKKDGENRMAKAGKLLGWIILSLFVVGLIVAAITVSSL